MGERDTEDDPECKDYTDYGYGAPAELVMSHVVQTYTLAADAYFTLDVDGKALDLVLPASVTAGNATLGDLIADLQAILDSALIANRYKAGDVIVGSSPIQWFGTQHENGDALKFTAKSGTGISSISIITPDSPMISALKFSSDATASASNTVTSTAVMTTGFTLDHDAIFTLAMSTNQTITVTLLASDTATNSTLDDLIGDLQRAVNARINGVQVGKVADGTDYKITLTGATPFTLTVVQNPARAILNLDASKSAASAVAWKDGSVTPEDIVFSSDDFVSTNQPCGLLASYCQVIFHIQQALASVSFPLSFDIGVPIGFTGLSLAVDGNIKFEIAWEMNFGFGFSKKDGFYFDVSAPEELAIGMKISLPGSAEGKVFTAKGQFLLTFRSFLLTQCQLVQRAGHTQI